MREAFAHEAVLTLSAGADTAALGAAVTMALCGHWEHEPPCPLAPHHSAVTEAGDDVVLRTLFAVEPTGESEVRARITEALAGGQLAGSEDTTTRWRLRSSAPSVVAAGEREHAERLTNS
ncbi:MAG TPA: hypothetical protein VHM65_07360 [Candidatus Lustribacter sp.]|nr:hypothetical protein [Candidatus Lustribacter sp.]